MKIKSKQIQERAQKILRVLAEKSFITSLCLILLAILIGAALFYKYNILLFQQEPSPAEVSLKLQKQAYQEITSEWEKMQDNFEKADFKNYLNPFEIK